MRARKLAAVASEETPPDAGADTWPPDEEPVVDAPVDRTEDGGPVARLCLACGADDCHEHRENVRLDAPSRAIHDAIARLRRLAAEHRAAERSLRALVLTEVARGRGELEATPVPLAQPCPRCLIRDAEAAAAASGVTKTTRRAKGENGQQALPFKGS